MFFSIQTNGTLLTEKFVNACDIRNVGISLSLDGMQPVHDKHRKYKNGLGSYNDVIKGITILKNHPKIFEGIIGVIDPYSEPQSLFSFYESQHIDNIDLLLPDSTYLDPPAGRNDNPDLYKEWLISAFDSWFFNFQSIRFRTFESLLGGLLGRSTGSDSFGLGSLDYLTIETDGSYHTSDILKVAFENASYMGIDLQSSSIDNALCNDKISEYNMWLSKERLPQKCKKCPYGGICGGGSLPHRYSPENLFDNPTIYCEEMFALIRHAQIVMEKAINEETIS